MSEAALVAQQEVFIDEADRLHEACGVYGIYAPGTNIPELVYKGIQQLQHRGQEGAGIAVSYDSIVHKIADIGLVKQAFHDGDRLDDFPKGLAILGSGQVRYATTDTPEALKQSALQPMTYQSKRRPELPVFTLSTNGHGTDIALEASERGVDIAGASSDSELAMRWFGKEFEETGDVKTALLNVLPDMPGSFSTIVTTPDTLFAMRDRQGFRPLHLGQRPDGGYIVASEIQAIRHTGGVPLREVEPGELIMINEDGLQSFKFAEPEPAACAFEFVYFSSPATSMSGELVTNVRERMGARLAMKDKESGLVVDGVVGVPKSGVPAADGYHEESGLKHIKALNLDPYASVRSFILPEQTQRRKAVRDKITVIPELVDKKRLVVTDDSIVRGTTLREVVAMLKEAGAAEVHLRISSGEYRYPCRMGMDTGNPKELIANNMTNAQMCEYFGCDSLVFLDEEDIQAAVGQAAGKLCMACMTGEYPIRFRSLEEPQVVSVS